MSAIRRVVAAFAAIGVLLMPLAIRADDPVEVNAIVPMTGGAAFIGKDYSTAFNALETYVNKHGGINGHPLKFIVADDQSNPQTSVQPRLHQRDNKWAGVSGRYNFRATPQRGLDVSQIFVARWDGRCSSV